MPEDVAAGGARLRRDRQLRRRDARRPLDPRRRGVRPHRVPRHPGAARARCANRGSGSSRSRPTRSTATSRRAAPSRETDPLRPSSPYSAAKAAGDLLVLAYVRTFGVAASITRGSNTYGPNQYPEKFIPLFVTNALDGQALPLYGDGRQVRDWLYVEDHCAGIELVLREGGPGEIYNVGGGDEHENIEVAQRIIELTGADPALLRRVEDRPGHDRRYSLDTTKLRALGWRPEHAFEDGLRATVDWYRENRAWWEPIKSGELPRVLRAAVRAAPGPTSGSV